MRQIAIALVFVISFVGVSCQFGKKKPINEKPPTSLTVTKIEPVNPVQLSANSVDQFISWAGRSDSSDHLRIREEITKSGKNNDVLELLFQRLDKTGLNDLGKSLVILSIIGEMRNEQSLKKLAEIVWKPLPKVEAPGHAALNERDYSEMLASKAVECIAYLKTPESDKVTLEVIKKHESLPIRAAAIDAYLYNHGDSERERDRLREIVLVTDRPFVDCIRKSTVVKKEAFNEGLKRFYEKYPDQVAPLPEKPTGKMLQDSGKIDTPVPPPIKIK